MTWLPRGKRHPPRLHKSDDDSTMVGSWGVFSKLGKDGVALAVARCVSTCDARVVCCFDTRWCKSCRCRLVAWVVKKCCLYVVGMSIKLLVFRSFLSVVCCTCRCLLGTDCQTYVGRSFTTAYNILMFPTLAILCLGYIFLTRLLPEVQFILTWW